MAQGLAWPPHYPGRVLRNRFTDRWHSKKGRGDTSLLCPLIDRIARSGNLAAAISIAYDIVGEQGQVTVHIAICTGVDQLVQDVVLLFLGSMISWTIRSRVLARPAHDLAIVALTLLHYCDNFRVFIVKDLAQQENGAFYLCQLF